MTQALPKLRIALIVFIAGWMIGGPLWTQVLGQSSPWFVRRWRMYHGYAGDVCVVQFDKAMPDGSRVAVDRYAVQGYGPDKLPPSKVRVISGRKGVRNEVKRLCSRLPAGTDLRAVAECGHPKGWKQVATGRRNVCAAAAGAQP